VPGPDTYLITSNDKIPGFVIMQDSQPVKREGEEGAPVVGPQTYNPVNPNHKLQSKNKLRTMGMSERPDLVSAANVPGPGKYELPGDFEKAVAKPKFHMGIKTQGFAGNAIDMPGPGEYETDVIPIHHSNVAYYIGTSVRGDLGVGKAYMFPGPGEYEAPVDSTMDPTIRIAGTFGTEKKDTVIKKSFAPAPGSYEVHSTVGVMPYYLRTEENRALKAAQEAALRARLEI
jgi:hypothetical protein